MKFNRKCFIFIYCLSVSLTAQTQEIVSIDFRSNISQFVGDLLISSLGINLNLDNGVDIYRVTYTVVGSDMQLDTASGLLMLPDIIDKDLPILVYQHGTTDGRSDVPSNLNGGYQLGAIFAAKNMIVLVPDYLGLGTSRGFHPYVHARTEATAAVEMLVAIEPFLEQNEIVWNEQLFITGYSQGGHAAMALHKYIQEEIPEEYKVVASLPMSGPYNISGVMKDLAFTDEPYGFPSYLIYSTLGIREIYPEFFDDISQIFRPPYIDAINQFISTGDGLFDMNESIIQTLIAETGQSIPKLIFKDSILSILEDNPGHLFNMALRESDVFDWTPKAPVLMLYCEDDNQVPFKNSTLADSIMNLNGAENVKAQDVSNGATLDHSECIVPALNVGIPWLLGFIDASTPTADLVQNSEILIYPNPTSGFIKINSGHEISQLEVYNFSGQKIHTSYPSSKELVLTLDGILPGIYLTHLYTDGGLTVRKIIVHQ